MALCVICSNPRESCDCGSFTEATSATAPSWQASRVGVQANETQLIDEVKPARRETLSAFITGVRSMGCMIEHPTGERDDYVNIRPPTGYDEYCVGVITRSTGRIQFRPPSSEFARSLGLTERFDHLGQDKVAINLDDERDVQAALAVTKAMLDARRATG